MTEEELKALADRFRQKLALDPEIRSLSKKIADGTADFSDTSRLFWRRSVMLREYTQDTVLDLAPEDRQRLVEALLHRGYDDTTEALTIVQEALDEAQGLHLNPVVPKYPAERVVQVAHALMDPTVPDEKIVRRAGAPVANVNMSFHDDYMKENAKIRAKLGFKCYLNRVAAAGCCKWCTDIAGRYVYGDQPDDVFHRHDNCGCTVTFENGRERQDVWSKRTWQASPLEVMRNGFQPARNSPAQAAKINENALDGLTLAGERDIITGRGSGTGSAFGEHTFEKIGNVDPNDKKAVAALLAEFERKYRDSPIEHCRVITANGEVYEVHGGKYTVNTTLLGDKMAGSTNEHNHVTGESQHSFSWDDLRESVDDHSKVVIAYDERYRYHMIFPDNNLDPDYVSDVYQMAENSVGNDLIFHPELIPEGDEQHERIRRACEKLGIEYARKEIPR